MDNNSFSADFKAENEDKSEEDMHKTSPYVRTVVTLHNLRDRAKDAVDSLHEINFTDKVNDSWNKTQNAVKSKSRNFFTHPEDAKLNYVPQKFGYVFRDKSAWELVLLGGTVCGIEFCYAAETAFVTPILLGLGLNIKFVTMIWCLSPIIGLFLTPILGSMSDSCEASMGRRRPFIILYSIGILSGLILVSNGHLIGLALGDHDFLNVKQLSQINFTNNNNTAFNSGNLPESLKITKLESTTEKEVFKEPLSSYGAYLFRELNETINPEANAYFKNGNKLGKKENPLDFSTEDEVDAIFEAEANTANINESSTIPEFSTLVRRRRELPEANVKTSSEIQPWSIAFTVIGTIFLDFCSDACQSPSRTYMLDVSIPDDHAAGLSAFTLMAGLGGSVGYLMGAIQWEDTFLGHLLGSQVSVVFTIVTVIFVVCLLTTICSFPEIPLSVLRNPKMFEEYQEKMQPGSAQGLNGHELSDMNPKPRSNSYGSTEQNEGFENEPEVCSGKIEEVLPPKPELENQMAVAVQNGKSPVTEINVAAELNTSAQHPTLLDFLKSIVHMPRSLKILCVTNLFCWMSLVCYSLYFTDFVAECVFGGDPLAPEGSAEHNSYRDGVRFGCWGMSLYSLSCAIYSYFIEAIIKKIGAKPTYIGGQLVYSVGMVVMAVTRHKVAVILLSPTAGIMYATLFTMPYLLIAHYHCTNKFSESAECMNPVEPTIRGIGTDVAAVSSMVFLSQFVLSLSMGTIVEAVGSNVATVCAASLLSACGALCATQVLYLEV
ncbi:hypothetical protein JTE90_001960 [Oedothorax gibbosus]|uniref:Proton-associated sugar transporter A n=1 Tax=Oedothorax gibbosus TaxID=931172 RepID=A0AAV6VU97_9ARAC|nr:hypothetical protein JTE90_001960 [Oedothorax gibbosus]